MKKVYITLSLVSFLLLGAAFWSWQKLNFVKENESSLKLALDDVVESLDPVSAFSDDALVVSAQVLEPLYQYHYLKRPYEIESLASQGLPSIHDEGKRVRIKIKQGLYFHPHPAFEGKKRELMAQDFVTQFKRLAMDSLKSPGQGFFSGLIEGFNEYGKKIGDNWEKLQFHELPGVKAIDAWTLEIRLKRSEPNLTYYLAMNFTAPVPWEIVQYHKNDLSIVLVGTGPYLYQGYNGQYYEMEKNPEYRPEFYPTAGDRFANVQNLLVSSKERIPFINNVRFYVSSNERGRWEQFINKEIDLLNVPKTFIPLLYDEKGEMNPELKANNVELKHFPILANRWLAFNMKDPLVGKNGYLRRAIAFAIDYSRYIELLSQNTNLRANSILVPGISGYRPAQEFRFKFDPELAKEYLKMAGFSNPNEMPTITYSTRGNQGISLIEADFIKEMLETIGLKVNIQILSFSEFLTKGRAGELMFFTDNWMFDYPNGENILQLLVSHNFPGINKAAYSNPIVDKLYLDLKETMSSDERDKIIHKIEELVFEDLPWIPMMYESTFILHYPPIKNYRKSSIIRNYVKYLKVDR